MNVLFFNLIISSSVVLFIKIIIKKDEKQNRDLIKSKF